MTTGMPSGQELPLPWAGAGSSLGHSNLTTHYYLNILAKEAGMKADPVGGDVEPALEKEVPLEGAGAHWEVTGEKTAMSKSAQEAPGLGLHNQESTVQPQHLPSSDSLSPSQAPISTSPQVLQESFSRESCLFHFTAPDY